MNKEFVESRRNFLKSAVGITAGALLTTRLGKAVTAVAEEEKIPFAWVPSNPPCKLIKEVESKTEGARSFEFTTDGRSCSKLITFDIVGKEEYLCNVVYDTGCPGGSQGIAHMVEGRTCSEVLPIISNVVCRNKQSGSSCAHQLSLGVKQALLIIHGTPCPGCESSVCVNVK